MKKTIGKSLYIERGIDLAILLFFFLYLTVTNYTVDAANIFNNTAKEIGEAIAKGDSIYLIDGNIKDKEFKYTLIKNMPDKTDSVAIGSSLIMGVRRENTGDKIFFNLAHSWADLYDILAVMGMLKANNKETSRMIICIDSRFFSESVYSANESPYRCYAEYMIDVLDNTRTVIKPKDGIEKIKQELQQLFSLTYFQANIEYSKKNGAGDSAKKWGYMSDGTDTSPYYCYLDDGSLVYNLPTRLADASSVVEKALNYDMSTISEYDEPVSEFSKEMLIDVIKYYKQGNTEIEIFLCPLAPSLWDNIPLEHYPILVDGESYIKQIQREYNIKVTGSFNPHNIGISDEDFLDPRHVRHEELSCYFDFTLR